MVALVAVAGLAAAPIAVFDAPADPVRSTLYARSSSARIAVSASLARVTTRTSRALAAGSRPANRGE